MKKFNNKGFLLVETVIVSVFVLTIFVLVYQNSLPMIEEYKKRAGYDDVDTVYAAGLMRNLILGDINYGSFKKEVDRVGYKVLTCSDLEKSSVCEALVDEIGMKKNGEMYGRLVLSKWNVSKVTQNDSLPGGFLDYVLYLRQQNQQQVTEYRLLFSRVTTYEVHSYDDTTAEIKKEEKLDYHYANIGM